MYRFIRKLFNKFIEIIIKTVLFSKTNIELGQYVNIIGLPIINIHNSAKLIIESNVTLNSSNYNYHINMYSPVKIMADRRGAVIVIGDNTRIHGTCIHAYKSIEIGKNCLIAANTQIFDGSGHDLSMKNPENRINTQGSTKPIVIEDNVWIGANSIILPGTRIGKASVVSAGSVVRGNIPPYSLVAGNPVKKIRTFKDNHA